MEPRRCDRGGADILRNHGLGYKPVFRVVEGGHLVMDPNGPGLAAPAGGEAQRNRGE